MLFPHTIIYSDGSRARQRVLSRYFVDYCDGGDKLVVTFEGAGNEVARQEGSRKPWGFDFLRSNGCSVLGIKPKAVDWYRGPELHSFLRSEKLRLLVQSHAQVFLFGGSMGGYAALAFADAFPGCTSIALNPQTTLHRNLVPWEQRYPQGQKWDWDSDFSDGRSGALAAKKVYVVYDPFHRNDRRHIDRLDPKNVVKLKIPFVGHCVPVWMHKMGILKETVGRILQGNLSEQDFRRLAEARKNLPRYYVQIAERKAGSCLARACVEKALLLNPQDFEALAAMCRLLLREKRYAEVIAQSEKLPGITGAEFAAQAFFSLGRIRMADKVLSRPIWNRNISVHQLRRYAKIAGRLGRHVVVERIAKAVAQRTGKTIHSTDERR